MDFRRQFPGIFQAEQTSQIPWQPNLLQVAKVSDAGMKTLRTAGSDEGSNV